MGIATDLGHLVAYTGRFVAALLEEFGEDTRMRLAKHVIASAAFRPEILFSVLRD
jgi:hypothetical protein